MPQGENENANQGENDSARNAGKKGHAPCNREGTPWRAETPQCCLCYGVVRINLED